MTALSSRRAHAAGTLPAFLLGLLLAPALLGGCGESDRTIEITDVRERPAGSSRPTHAATIDERFGRSAHGSMGAQASATPRPPAWAYETPSGWTELPPQPMRDAGWQVGGDGTTLCTLSQAGGSVEDNVNRWRRQMGLDPVSAEEIASLPKGSLLGMEAVRVDLRGAYGGMGGAEEVADARMLGLVLPGMRGLVFLKMVGPAAVVDSQVESFERLAASIEPAPTPAATMPPGHGTRTPEAPTAGGSAGLSWQAPEGWVRQPERTMREVTFAPRGDERTECYVTVLNGDGGGIGMNVNRWRGQMGQPALSAAELEKLPRIQVMGRDAVLVTIEGDYETTESMGGGQVDAAAMLGLVLLRGSDSVFVKMIGPANVVLGERENFEAFCRSLSE